MVLSSRQLVYRVSRDRASLSVKKTNMLRFLTLLKPEGTLEFWFKPNWQGDPSETYRLFDAASDKIFWFVGKASPVSAYRILASS